MSYSVFVDTALQLPAPDVEALIEGRVIAAMPRIFIEPGRSFALYPANISINLLPLSNTTDRVFYQLLTPHFLS